MHICISMMSNRMLMELGWTVVVVVSLSADILFLFIFGISIYPFARACASDFNAYAHICTNASIRFLTAATVLIYNPLDVHIQYQPLSIACYVTYNRGLPLYTYIHMSNIVNAWNTGTNCYTMVWGLFGVCCMCFGVVFWQRYFSSLLLPFLFPLSVIIVPF